MGRKKLMIQDYPLSRSEMLSRGLEKRFYFKSVSPSFGEIICRKIFEWIFNKSFPSQYPIFLGDQELDGFNAELMIAFEHQGIYHNPLHTFGRWDGQFKDKFKEEICNENGVYLIQIPCIDSGLKNINIGFENILKQLNQYNIRTRLEDIETCYLENHKEIFLQELYNLRKKLLNNKFKNKYDYFLFEDSTFIKPNISTFYFSFGERNFLNTSICSDETELENRITHWIQYGYKYKIYNTLTHKVLIITDHDYCPINVSYKLRISKGYNIYDVWCKRYEKEIQEYKTLWNKCYIKNRVVQNNK